jgi:hypothetical protein
MYIYTISDSDTQVVNVESEVKLDVSSYSSKARLSTTLVTQSRFRILI